MMYYNYVRCLNIVGLIVLAILSGSPSITSLPTDTSSASKVLADDGNSDKSIKTTTIKTIKTVKTTKNIPPPASAVPWNSFSQNTSSTQTNTAPHTKYITPEAQTDTPLLTKYENPISTVQSNKNGTPPESSAQNIAPSNPDNTRAESSAQNILPGKINIQVKTFPSHTTPDRSPQHNTNTNFIPNKTSQPNIIQDTPDRSSMSGKPNTLPSNVNDTPQKTTSVNTVNNTSDKSAANDMLQTTTPSDDIQTNNNSTPERPFTLPRNASILPPTTTSDVPIAVINISFPETGDQSIKNLLQNSKFDDSSSEQNPLLGLQFLPLLGQALRNGSSSVDKPEEKTPLFKNDFLLKDGSGFKNNSLLKGKEKTPILKDGAVLKNNSLLTGMKSGAKTQQMFKGNPDQTHQTSKLNNRNKPTQTFNKTTSNQNEPQKEIPLNNIYPPNKQTQQKYISTNKIVTNEKPIQQENSLSNKNVSKEQPTKTTSVFPNNNSNNKKPTFSVNKITDLPSNNLNKNPNLFKNDKVKDKQTNLFDGEPTHLLREKPTQEADHALNNLKNNSAFSTDNTVKEKPVQQDLASNNNIMSKDQPEKINSMSISNTQPDVTVTSSSLQTDNYDNNVQSKGD